MRGRTPLVRLISDNRLIVRDESVIDLFAGPGGWDLAAGAVGLEPLGVEWDAAACATREAAGLRTVQADVSALDPVAFMREHFSTAGGRPRGNGHHPLWGLIGSPPCQAFSMAGKGAGRKAMDAYAVAIRAMAHGEPMPREWLDEACHDERAHLILEPLRWAMALEPRWVALEQVEPVLPLWEAVAVALRERGYQTWTGVLSAERFGVPQTRRRAFMLASLDGPVASPVATHQRYIPPRKREEATLGLFDAPEAERIVAPEDRELLPWVSMAEALGWDRGDRIGFPRLADTPSNLATGRVEIDGKDYRERDLRPASQPAFVMTEKGRSWLRFRANAQSNAAERGVDEPAPTITGGHDFNERVWVGTGRDWKEGGSRDDAQTFDPEGRPAPAVDGKGRWHVEYRRGGERLEESTPVDAPAPTVTSRTDRWQVKPDERRQDWPAERPATTVAGDPRVFPPGHKINDEDVRAGRGGQRRSGAGWTDERPSPTVVGTRRSSDGAVVGRQLPAGEDQSVGGWSDVESAPGKDGKAVRVTLQEALVLQSFPPDYPVQGNKTKQFEQVGNAVPPGLAFAVLLAVLPAEVEAAA